MLKNLKRYQGTLDKKHFVNYGEKLLQRIENIESYKCTNLKNPGNLEKELGL